MKRSLWSLLVVTIFTLSVSATAHASHQLGGNISWVRDQTFVSTTDARYNIHVELALRWGGFDYSVRQGDTSSFSGTPPIDSQINEGGAYVFTYGPLVTEVPLEWVRVQTINAAEGWMFATGDISLTVPRSSLPLTLSYEDCCRSSLLADGNNDKDFRLATVITNEGGATRSPSSTTVPRIYAEANAPLDFFVPAVNADGLPTQFRLATSAESGLVTPAPSGFAISSNGHVTWTPTTIGIYGVQLVAQNASGAKIPLDLAFQVIAPQPKVSFAPGLCGASFPSYVGLPTTIPVSATSSRVNDPVIIAWTPLPNGAVMTGSSPSYTLNWTPSLGQSSANVCLQATSASGLRSVGNCCLTMEIQTGSLFNLSGIIRDFSVVQPDFNSPDGDLGTGFLATTLNAAGKPTIRSGARPTTVSSPASFDAWWNTTPANRQQVSSLTLSNGGQASSGVYAFSSNAYYPIDGQLLGNEGALHNGFFTYEAHSYISYQAGAVLQYSSADDLWVFIDGKLAVDLGGVHSAATASVSLDSLGLTAGRTYRFDVFYAHRGRHAPVLGLQLVPGVVCDPLAVSPFVAFSGQSSDFNFLGQAAPNADGSLRVLKPGVANASSAVWYRQPLPVASGFRAEFDVAINPGAQGGAEGLAFVLQSNGPGIRGASGAGLGYDGIPNSIAFELDSHFDSIMFDPNFEQFGIHTRLAAPNSAQESYAIGSSANEIPLIFDNGSSQHVVVDYRPNESPSGGFLRGYVNSNVAPVVVAPIDNQAFVQAVGTATYLGFTSSSGPNPTPSTTPTATVDVRNWKLTVNVGMGGRLLTPPAAVLPQTMGQFVVQAVDGCGQGILVGGQEDEWTVTMTDGPALLSAAVIDNNDGTYAVQYVPTVAGVWHVNVAFGGVAIPGSPLQITAAPVVITNVPANISVEAMGPLTSVSWAAPTAAVLGEPLPVFCSPSSGTTFPVGTGAVNCSASDSYGNSASASFNVTVTDTTPPLFGLSNDVSAEATGPDGAAVAVTAVATDLVDGAITAVCTPTSGSTFALGATSVSCTATDAHGNASSASLTVTVGDTTPPELGAGSNVTVEATGPAGAIATYAAPTAHDLVGGDLSGAVHCTPASGSTFALGKTTVSCTVADADGNTAGGELNVYVIDSTAPVFTAPSDLTVEATPTSGVVVTYAVPEAMDAVEGPVPVTCLPASGSLFPLGDTVVHCTASDRPGNVTDKTFNVMVVDTTPPLLVLPGTVTAEATSPAGASVAFVVAATDAVDGVDAVYCSASSGDTFPLGTTVVQCSSDDEHGNGASGSFAILVKDTSAPAITGMPGPQTVSATSPTGAAVTYAQPTASDLVDGAVTVQCAPASGSTFPLGTTTVSCDAHDAAGNAAHQTFVVTVSDDRPPVFGSMPSPTAYATSTAGAVVSYTPPTAFDDVEGARLVTCTPPPGSTFAPGSTTVACTSSDSRGNTATVTFKVTVTYQAPTDGSFYVQPINADGSSIFKLGTTVPVKFALTAASAAITTLAAKVYVAKISNGIEGTAVEATSNGAADGGNTFRYSSGQYIFNLSTKSLSKGTWVIRADLGDGVDHSVHISLG